LTPGWLDDPGTVAEANARPEVLAGKSVGEVADHFEDVIRRLDIKPVVIGHSFGGLLAQILGGRGLAAATVAIDPAPFRGVLPLPLSALRVGCSCVLAWTLRVSSRHPAVEPPVGTRVSSSHDASSKRRVRADLGVRNASACQAALRATIRTSRGRNQ
jgi:pimeloyl-ACP methyl ester carboxylesterase